MNRLLTERGHIRMVFAAAPSQNELLAHLAQHPIDWSRVTAFHMDEYIGLAPDDPRRFAHYLRTHLFDLVRPGAVHILDPAGDPEQECRRYTRLLQEAPIDVICLGIGENGHIAFNDPGVADFEDPAWVKVVPLDPRSRMQQVHDGCFPALDEVPTAAVTLTVPVFRAARHLVAVVPGPTKREAVRRTLQGPISPECPASILRTHPDVVLFLDLDAYGGGDGDGGAGEAEAAEARPGRGCTVAPTGPARGAARTAWPEPEPRVRVSEGEAPLRVEGRHYRTGAPVAVEMSAGRIVRVTPAPERPGLPFIGPGLVDLQVNGFRGIDFNTRPLDVAAIQRVVHALWAEGVTAFLPTIITNSDEAIAELAASVAHALRDAADGRVVQGLWDPPGASEHGRRDRSGGIPTIPGIHLEGPFISPEDGPRGAHDRRYVQPPDWDRFQRWQEAAEGRIRLVTLSPEWPEAVAFIARCAASGVRVAIGHTAAGSDQIAAAVRAGATLSTHLGNGAHPRLPRHSNYIWDQLACDELWASVIADGFHLPDAVLKVFLRAKGERVFLVSDVVDLGGLAPGRYTTHIGGDVVLTPEGKLHLAHHPELLAGSVQSLRQGVGNLVAKGLCSLADAWVMASVRPADYLGLPVARDIAPGEPADLVLFTFDGQVHVERTVKAGVIVHDARGETEGGSQG
ncbi:6-phosphogluconolactonase [Alicyclobacillus macrosporangiidus]|uniref:6-phosphogluconolactonase n=1 Tax=Alicyclobacillus macrosporangiidus TaxID=392015 RepID=UPI002F352C45